ncbi:MAG: sugar ABC transporter ATP-binding protein [Ferrimicrobium acidiphilum]
MVGVSVEHVYKEFGGTQALHDVSFVAEPGSITAVVGSNGAGKSTMMQAIAGVVKPDAGVVRFGNEIVEAFDPRLVLSRFGVVLVPQELEACLDASIAANVYLGNEPRRHGLIDRQAMETDTLALLSAFGVAHVDPRKTLRNYGLAIQQIVVIARAVARNAKVIILDEPTAAITEKESAQLLAVIRNLAASGVTILYVSHRIPEVLELADKVIVLRDGRKVGESKRGQLDRAMLVRQMVGNEGAQVDYRYDRSSVSFRRHGERVVKADSITAQEFSRVSLEICEGEIVGLAGLPDSGSNALVRSLYGLGRVSAGMLVVLGKEGGFAGPREAMNSGVKFITGDRGSGGIFPNMSVAENLVMLDLNLGKLGWGGFVSRREVLRRAQELSIKSNVRTSSVSGSVKSLSGGNQQKVVVARALATTPRLLLADDPTRGVDVGSRREIHSLIREFVDTGGAAFVLSSDWEELVELCTRVVVMYRGASVGNVDVDGNGADSAQLIRMLAVGGEALDNMAGVV